MFRYHVMVHALVGVCLLFSLSACSMLEESFSTPAGSQVAGVHMLNDMPEPKQPPPSSRVTMDDVQDKAEKWFFGPGLGRAMTNVGTSILFPPYALYLLGNATLSLTGLQPLYMTDLLPDKPRDGVLEVYDAFTSVPGRLTSAIAGRDYPAPVNNSVGTQNAQ